MAKPGTKGGDAGGRDGKNKDTGAQNFQEVETEIAPGVEEKGDDGDGARVEKYR